ncbi:MAG TPA: TraB/GumN family protein [Devosia sp.]
MLKLISVPAILLLLAIEATPSLAAPAMWEVRDEDSTIWLFGSFHVLPEALQWRTPLFDQTLANADKIVFEADVRAGAIAAIGAEAFLRGIYTDGTLLTDVIDEPTENKLRAIASDLSLPVGSLLAMKPWFAALTVSSGATVSLGYTGEGVEYVLQPELAAERQAYLESGNQQLDVLSAAPEAEQLAMFKATLDEMDGMPKVLDKMTSSWIKGTPEKLADLFLSETGTYGDAFLERLIYARNRNWIPAIETMLAGNSEALVIVGAGHLIGDGSVIDLLEKQGYTIRRIQ